ncbi:MAG: hypothetical protein ABI462_02215 [Ignavibacteria bacterium]
MDTNSKQTQNSRQGNFPSDEIRNDRDTPESKNKLLTYLLSALGVILIAVLLFFALSGESNYDKGVKYLHQKQYSEALAEFQKVDPADKEFRMAQSKINYINGLRAYNDNIYSQAITYLTKVDPADEYYRESQLMIDKMNMASKQQTDLELLSEQVKKDKDTVIIKEKVVEAPQTTINEASPKADMSMLKIENLVNKFELEYQSALKSNIETKQIHLRNMDSLYSEFQKLDSKGDEGATLDIRKLADSWMQKRETFINRLISENTVNETGSTHSLKEDGDREYSLLISRLKNSKN